ncbi:MAG: hypothetical protein KDD47_22485, partial [Acidobacteria bacterium]|nr:hypothetical protein [Acidobacteriota bacterium]
QRVTNRDTTPKETTYSHLLSDELSRVEKQEGFSFNVGLLTPNKAQLYVSVVSPGDFRAQLRSGYHWKDPGVPGAHGEFTHRIQWYILARSGVFPRGTLVRLFKAAGRPEWVADVDPPVNGADEIDLWQILCDRDRYGGANPIVPKADSAADFRCPEHFGEYASGTLDPGTYPILRGFLEARFRKRQNWNVTDYVAKKLFHQPFNALIPDQRYQVYAVIGNRALICANKYGVPYEALNPNQKNWVDAAMGKGILRWN